MPKLFSTLLRAQIHLIKPLLKGLDLQKQRKTQDRLGRLGAKVLKGKVEYVCEAFPFFQADWAIPQNGCENGAILYLHGGSYTAGCLEYARGFGGIIAETTKRKTLCIGYRLAPEYPYPAALDDAYAAYNRIIQKYPANNITIIGESAGGGLALALALRLKEEGIPHPGCIIGISPWTDLTMSGASYQTNARKDPSLSAKWLCQSAIFYCGNDCKNPFVSPLFGDLSGLPPCLIFAGTFELLMDDAVQIANKLRDKNVFCEDHIVEGMWHAYVLYGISEAKDALKRIADFINEHTTTE